MKVVVVTVLQAPNVVTPRRPSLIDTRMVMHCMVPHIFLFIFVEFVCEAFILSVPSIFISVFFHVPVSFFAAN